MSQPLRCHCGATLDWPSLPSVGEQEVLANEPDDVESEFMPRGGKLVLKNCPACGTTLAEEAPNANPIPKE